MADRTRGYANRIEIDAPLELAWHALVDPLKLRLWFGPEARVTPREGGSYFVRAASDLAREAHIDVFEPGRRLRLIYMTPRELRGDAVLVDDFVITREGHFAVVHVLGSGFPMDESWDAYYNRLRGGWPRALARLKVLVERDARALVKGDTRRAGARPPEQLPDLPLPKGETAAPAQRPGAPAGTSPGASSGASSGSSAGNEWKLID